MEITSPGPAVELVQKPKKPLYHLSKSLGQSAKQKVN